MELTEESVIAFIRKQPNGATVFEMRDGMNIDAKDFPEKLNGILRSSNKFCSGLYHYGDCTNGHGNGGPHGYERRYFAPRD